jgi:hypothetical protein
MVLNALEVPAPAAFDSYRLFTQDNVFDALSDPITSDRAVARRGMALIEVASVLRPTACRWTFTMPASRASMRFAVRQRSIWAGPAAT